MDSYLIYKYYFERLYKSIKFYNKDINFEERKENQIIDIGANAFKEYQRVISGNEGSVRFFLEEIIKKLFELKCECYECPTYEVTLPSSGRVKKYPSLFSFVLKEENKNIGYILLFRQSYGLEYLRADIKKYYNYIDEVRFCFLQNDFRKNNDLLIKAFENEKYFKFYDFKDFFISKFGEEEYSVFLNYVNDFNERVKALIKIKISEIPTQETIHEFRKKVSNLFQNYDLEKKCLGIIESRQLERIRKNIIEKNLYKTVISDSTFSDSFISSEWYYEINTITGALDQTGVVAGYLKSIEQLLYSLIRLHINQNKTIRIKPNEKDKVNKQDIINENYIIFSEKNEQYADTTLGSLIRFINRKDKNNDFYNKDLFDVDSSTIQTIVDLLYTFKDNERNDRFHKDNLYSLKEIEEIRDKSFMLFLLLLGSFKIEDRELTKILGFDESDSMVYNDEQLKQIIIDWINPIMIFDFSKESDNLRFMLDEYDGEYELLLHGDIKKKEMLYVSPSEDRLHWKSNNSRDYEKKRLKNIILSIIEDNGETAKYLKQYGEIQINYDNIFP